MKILVINHFWGLDPRTVKEIDTLAADGHEVEVLNWNRMGDYSKPAKNDVRAKVEWIDVQATRGSLKLVFTLPSFYWKVIKTLEKKDVDVVLCTHIMLLPLACLIGRIKGAKVVYDAFEAFSIYISEYTPYISGLTRRAIELIENAFVARTDCVLTINTVNGFLAERYNRYNGNVTVLYNVPELESGGNHTNLQELKDKYKNSRVVVYVGGIYKAKGLMQLLESVRIVRGDVPNVKLILVGLFHESSKKEAFEYIRTHNLEGNLEIISWLPYHEMISYLKIAEVGLAPYQRERKHFSLVSKGTATKFFDYMQAGLPIVGPNFFDFARVVEEEQCGILVDTKDAGQIAAAMKYLLQNPQEAKEMGERGRRAVLEKYNWSLEKGKLLRACEKMLQAPA